MSESHESETEQTEDVGISQDEEPEGEQWGSDQARQRDDRDIRTGDMNRGPAEEDEDQAI